jgi:hypothetical protein
MCCGRKGEYHFSYPFQTLTLSLIDRWNLTPILLTMNVMDIPMNEFQRLFFFNDACDGQTDRLISTPSRSMTNVTERPANEF